MFKIAANKPLALSKRKTKYSDLIIYIAITLTHYFHLVVEVVQEFPIKFNTWS